MKIKWFKYSFELHKYLGVVMCVFLITLSVTGLFLGYKGAFAWMQAPTGKGTSGNATTMISVATAIDKVIALKMPEFQTPDDIERIDIRPKRNVYKLRSQGNLAKEVRLDAQTGAVLGVSTRWSDWLEHIHTGEMWGEMPRRIVSTLMALTVISLSITGLVIWGYPLLRRKLKLGQKV